MTDSLEKSESAGTEEARRVALWTKKDVEIGHTPFMDPPARGKEALLEFMRPSMFERQTTELHATEVHGNVILAELIFNAVGKGSGVEVSQRNFQLFTVRDGMFVKWEVFFDREEAEGAVAVGELRSGKGRY